MVRVGSHIRGLWRVNTERQVGEGHNRQSEQATTDSYGRPEQGQKEVDEDPQSLLIINDYQISPA